MAHLPLFKQATAKVIELSKDDQAKLQFSTMSIFTLRL